MNAILLLLALGGLGIVLVLPIATLVLLVKVRREQEAGLSHLKREFRALLAEIKTLGETAAQPSPAMPETKPQRAAPEPISPERVGERKRGHSTFYALKKQNAPFLGPRPLLAEKGLYFLRKSRLKHKFAVGFF